MYTTIGVSASHPISAEQAAAQSQHTYLCDLQGATSHSG